MIGIDRYRHWRPLGNAVSDASGARSLFLRLGFEEATAPLLDERATGQAIRALVTDDLAALGEDDRLVLFYAGHGGTRVRSLGGRSIKTGYLIPVDAANESNRVATWIELEDWLRSVSTLPPRHILVILDACYSGVALSPVIKWGRDGGVSQPPPYATLQGRRSRLIITSALDDEIALDAGPVLGHSLFTGCLIQALTGGLDGEIGQDGRRWTTGSDVGRYLRKRVLAFPDHERRGRRQTPDFGSFDFDDRGEMLIPLLIDDTVADAPTFEGPATIPSTTPSPPAISPGAATRPPIPAATPFPRATSSPLRLDSSRISAETPGPQPPAGWLEELISRWRRRLASAVSPAMEPATPSPPAPRTIFGVSAARLGEPAFHRIVSGIVGAILIVVGSAGTDQPVLDHFEYGYWPMLSGITYLLIGLALKTTRAVLSLMVLRGCLFFVACASMVIYVPLGKVYVTGYLVLVLSLLVRMSRPRDPVTRIPIVGAALCLIPSWKDSVYVFIGGDFQAAAWLRAIDPIRIGSFPTLYVHNFSLWLVVTLALCCVVFAVPVRRIPLIAKAGPAVAVMLILWMPIEKMLLMMSLGENLRTSTMFASAFGFAPIAANLSILIMIYPAVYGSLRRGDRGASG